MDDKNLENLIMNKKNPLYITESEKSAMKIYGGRTTATYPELSNYAEWGYGIINTVFFTGVENELTRIMDDNTQLPSGMLDYSDEIIDIIVSLYSAMYKYGKSMQSEEKGVRVEREISAKLIAEKGETISNTSTSVKIYDGYTFYKKDEVRIKFFIEPGTPCVRYNDVLREDPYNEDEILIAPGVKAKIEKNEVETRSNKKMEIRVSAPEMPKPLTEEEKMEKERLLAVCLDKEVQKKAKIFLDIIYSFKYYGGKTKEKAKERLTKEEIDEYLNWKTALITVARFKIRERVLEIEQALAQQNTQYTVADIATLSTNSPEINSETVEDVMENGRGTAYREYPGGRHRCARVKITVKMLY